MSWLRFLLVLMHLPLFSGNKVVCSSVNRKWNINGNISNFSTQRIANRRKSALSQRSAFISNAILGALHVDEYSTPFSSCGDHDRMLLSCDSFDKEARSSEKRTFTLSLNIKKLRKMKRRKINRMNKDLELFKRVKERRLNNPNRLVDIRNINFLNDKCNLALMRLPVSPLVDLNGIVPFKMVPHMTSQMPFNPAPVLHAIGYRFKPTTNGKYERFCEPYPMDKILQIVDARSMGALSRMAGKYKITGDSEKIPTPMDGAIVEPGESVGKGYGFGLTRKQKPKNKPIALSNFQPYAPDSSNLIESLEELQDVKEEMHRYADYIKAESKGTKESSLEDGGIEQRDIAYEADMRNIVEGATMRQKYAAIEQENVHIPYIDDACNEGDIMRNPRYLGEYRYKYWYHPFYGNPTLPGEEKKLVEEYNRANPDKPLQYEEYKVDLIYCHSNGTIVYLGEEEDPYLDQAKDFVIEGVDDPREPRFVIQAKAGYIKENNLHLGQILPEVNSEMREKYFDNLFFMPKSVRREYPLHLPDGTPVQ